MSPRSLRLRIRHRSRHPRQVAAGAFFPLDREIKPIIALVMATISLVLIIACANIANLSLARAAAMRRQIAVRLALGAGRWRIVRYQLTESAVIACWAARRRSPLCVGHPSLYPIGMALLPESWTGVVLDLTPDVRVFGYTLLLALAAGVIFGLRSAQAGLVAADRRRPARQRARFSRARSGIDPRDALVVVQVAVCFMLLAAAALTVRSLQHTQSLDLGFRTTGVVYTRADVGRYGYTRPRPPSFTAGSQNVRTRCRT